MATQSAFSSVRTFEKDHSLVRSSSSPPPPAPRMSPRGHLGLSGLPPLPRASLLLLKGTSWKWSTEHPNVALFAGPYVVDDDADNVPRFLYIQIVLAAVPLLCAFVLCPDHPVVAADPAVVAATPIRTARDFLTHLRALLSVPTVLLVAVVWGAQGGANAGWQGILPQILGPPLFSTRFAGWCVRSGGGTSQDHVVLHVFARTFCADPVPHNTSLATGTRLWVCGCGCVWVRVCIVKNP